MFCVLSCRTMDPSLQSIGPDDRGRSVGEMCAGGGVLGRGVLVSVCWQRRVLGLVWCAEGGVLEYQLEGKSGPSSLVNSLVVQNPLNLASCDAK